MIWTGNSVSQVKEAQECPRLWHSKKILGMDDPQNAAAYRGECLHEACRYFLTHRAVAYGPRHDSRYPIHEYAPYVDALRARDLFPDGRLGEDYLVEHWFTVDSPIGPPYKGKIDLAIPSVPRVVDWKGTTNLRYALKPWEMKEDPQCSVYALSAEAEPVEVRLVYVEVKPRIERKQWDELVAAGRQEEADRLERLPKPPRSADKIKIVPVETTFTRAEALAAWDKLRDQESRMLEWSKIEDWRLVPGDPTAERCHKFGGCVSRQRCGIAPRQSGSKETSGMGWADRFKKSGADAPAPEVVEPGEPDSRGTAVTPLPGGDVHVRLGGPDGQGTVVPPDHRLVVGEDIYRDSKTYRESTGIVPPDAPPRDAYRSAGPPAPPVEKPKKERAPRKTRARVEVPPDEAQELVQGGQNLANAPRGLEESSAPAGTPDGTWAPHPLPHLEESLSYGVIIDVNPTPVVLAAVPEQVFMKATRPFVGKKNTPETRAQLARVLSGVLGLAVDAVPGRVELGEVLIAPLAGTPAPHARETLPDVRFNAPAPASASEPRAEPTGAGPVLLLDCYPTKGGPEYVASFEDWIGPAIDELNQDVMKKDGLPHWQLLPYGQAHAAIELCVAERVRKVGLPPFMHVSTYSSLARDCVPALIRAAAFVVKKTS